MKELETIRTSYNAYKDQIEDSIDKKTYVSIVNGYVNYFIDKVFEGEEMMFPHSLGTLAIKGRTIKPRTDDNGNILMPPDWKATKDLWERCPECKERKQLVFHLNEHTDGVRYKFVWNNKQVHNTNNRLYILTMSRFNKRRLAKEIKSGREYHIYS